MSFLNKWMQPGGFKGWMGEGTNRQDLGALLRYSGSAMNNRPDREGLQNYMLAKQMRAGRAEGQQLINDILQKKSPSYVAPQTTQSYGTGQHTQGPRSPYGSYNSKLKMSESTNNYGAVNDLGYTGGFQWGQPLLTDYNNATGQNITMDQFRTDSDIQDAAQNWNVATTDKFIAEHGLDAAIGKTINGVEVTRDGMRAVAHLGGKEGLRKFITSGGQYNPDDSYTDNNGNQVKGTSLTDYLAKFGGGGQPSTPQTGMSDARLAQVLGHPDIDPNVKQMMLARYQAQGGAQFRPATSEEAARYGAESGQIDTKTGRFHETKSAPKTEVNVDLSKGDLSPMWEAIDKDFASQYTKWVGGGGSDAKALIANIGGVLEKLEQGKPLTGALVGTMPDFVRAFTHPEAQDAKDRVESVVQRSMRETLGAQFTEKEGERLIARAYNPVLSPEMNAARLRSLFKVMESAAAAKDAMVDHANEHGTLRGYEGPRMPTASDFDAALDAASITPTQAVAPDAVPGPYGGASTPQNVPLISSQAEYDALPSGATYKATNTDTGQIEEYTKQ